MIGPWLLGAVLLVGLLGAGGLLLWALQRRPKGHTRPGVLSAAPGAANDNARAGPGVTGAGDTADTERPERRMWFALRFDQLLRAVSPTETILLLHSASWVAWLCWPDLDVFGASRSFAVMAAWGEPVWAGIWGALAGALLAALITQRQRGRLAALTCYAGLYSSLAASFLISNPATPGGGTYAAMGLGCIWLILRLGADQRATDRYRG